MRFLSLLLLVAALGCGSGEDDQQESVSSSSTVDIIDCSGSTFEVGSLEELAALQEAAGTEFEVTVPDFEQPADDDNVFDQQTRLRVVILPVGCGNTVINEDNDVVSDDDFVIDAGGDAEGDA